MPNCGKDEEKCFALKIGGGDKGHITEVVHDPVFIKLFAQFRWKMIPNCTGRYTCRDHKLVCSVTPIDLLQNAKAGQKFEQYYCNFAATKKDPIIVVPFSNDRMTGLISYIKHDFDNDEDVKYVHTLNSPSGFQRNLEAIGMLLCDENLVKDYEESETNVS